MKSIPPLVTTILFLLLMNQTVSAQSAQATSSFLRNFAASRPTTSPYLNLVQSPTDQLGGGGAAQLTNSYQNAVRPQMEQRRANQAQARQNQQVQRQMGQLQSQLQRSQEQGAFGITGHPTRFMQYYQYYPGFLSARRR